jgi:hypothetical protein
MATLSVPAPARRPAVLAVAWRVAAAVGVMLVVTLAGVGWLYLLRAIDVLAVGPRVSEALPLQRLAGSDAQPLLRVVVAWLPAGVVAGVALRALGVRGRGWRAVAAGLPCALLLVAFGAAADAITETDPLGAHLGAQLGRVAIWLAAALVALGAAL